MLKLNRIGITFLFFLVLGSVNPTSAEQPHQQFSNKPDYYKKGMQLVNQGEVKQALKVWLQAKAKLEVPSTRIGVAFIKTVTANDLEKYYEFATLMYGWGLSAQKLTTNKKAIRQIVERLALLAEHEQYHYWDEMFENNNPAIYEELHRFWQQLDITPATTYNERLIEHWQRINYAQKHFTKNNGEPFGTDDRGKIYVRYGKPAIQQSGRLAYTAALAKQYIYQYASAPAGVPNPTPKQVQIASRLTANFYRAPKYEIWVYPRKPYRDEKLIYIFGEAGGVTGGFGLVETVGDFIPRSAFRVGSTMMGSVPSTASASEKSLMHITAGLILQTIYYKQLAHIDPYFSSRFSDIISSATKYTGSTYISRYTGLRMEGKSTFRLHILKSRAPENTSSIAHKMARIPIKVNSYRLLNKQNEPVLLTFVRSQPYKAFWLDYINNYVNKDSLSALNEQTKNRILKNYQYAHYAQVYNDKGKLLKQAMKRPPIVSNNKISVSVFSIPMIEKGTDMIFTARLKNSDVASTYSINNLPFPDELRGLGTVKIEQPTPLANNSNTLQIGDLIVGYNYKKIAKNNVLLPFTIAHNKKISMGETLVVHVEVYHLQQDNAFGQLSISYQIKPEEGFLGFIDKDQQPLKLTLNIETKTSRYTENLRIQTRKLPPGEYTLVMTATDKKSGQAVKRKFSFEITESKNDG